MKRKTKKAIGWMIPGLVLSLLVFLVVFTGLKGNVTVTDPEGIYRSAEKLLQSIQSGDWEMLNNITEDHPGIQPQTGAEGTAERLIWNAYQESLQWSFADGFEIDGPQITLDATVSCLDISGFTRNLSGILAESTDEDQREAALSSAVLDSLEGELPTVQRTIQLRFVRREGQWQIVPNQALLALLSGFTAK